MHWQQELQYIWMYPNNAKQPLLRSCWCSFARIWQIVMQGRGVVVFVGCRFSTAVSAGFLQCLCKLCIYSICEVQYLWAVDFAGRARANIQLNSEAFANLRLEFKAQVFGLSWRIFKWENYIYTHSIYNIESLEYPKFCTISVLNEVRYLINKQILRCVKNAVLMPFSHTPPIKDFFTSPQIKRIEILK